MAMDHPQALPSLDIWTSALLTKSSAGRGGNGKVEAYGIKKLRELILELAVRGKLVAQDAHDEPASDLLKRIKAEKAKLIAEGKIKKEKPLPDIGGDEKPFELPIRWEWARLDAITSKITDGEHLSPLKTETGMKLLTAKHVLDNGITLEDPQYVSLNDGIRFRERCDPQTGDVLICSRGTIGRCCAIEVTEDFCLMGSVIHVRAFPQVDPQYLDCFLKSEAGQFFIRGATKGMAVNALYLKDIRLCPVSIPPSTEQHRIVAKVDELMALCDQLEQQQTDSLAAHQTLVETLLGTLTRVESQQEFSAAWARIANHFDTLFTTEASIDQLKQTIFKLAVMGKLVPQDPNDEPVGKALKLRIDPCEESTPFTIPNSWVWAHVEEFAETRLGKMLDKAKNKGTPVRYLRNINVRWFDFDLSDVKEMLFENSELDEFSLRNGDVLICEGGYPGRAAVWDERESNIYFQKAIHRVRFKMQINPTYFVYVLRESADSGRLNTYFTGAGIQHFTGKGLMSFLVPLPPIAEQDRIVAKVDELMALCDTLKARIKDARTTQLHLADANVDQAVC